MKLVQTLFVVLLVFSLHASCSSPTKNEGTPSTSNQEVKQVANEKVELAYFHFTRRCVTCNAIETVSKEAIAELYGDKVSFVSYNLDEEDGKAKGTELEVSGQTLMVVMGETKINITNEAFMNARSNPEKLKQIIKEKIDLIVD